MRTIYQARDFIKSNYRKSVKVKVIGLRNKIEKYEGIISECYNNIFIVDTDLGKKSFTYSDVLIGNIKVNVK